MFKQIISLTMTMTFVLVEPMFFMGEAYAAGKCQQNQQKIKQACSGNPSLQQGAVADMNEFDQLFQQGQKNKLQQHQADQQKAAANLATAKSQCTQANQQCQQDCEQEFNQAASKTPPDVQKMTMAKNTMKQCQQEEQETNAKNDKASGDIAKILAALASLLAALMGNDKSKEDIAKEEKKDEEDICKTPEGAILVKCQGESDPLRARASLSGMTGVASAGGATGQSLSRPLDGTPTASGNNTSGGTASVGSASTGAGGGFGNNGGFGQSAAAVPVRDAEKSDKNGAEGYLNAGSGGGGGGGSVGGGSARTSSFAPLSFNDPLLEGSEDGKGKGGSGSKSGGVQQTLGGNRGLAGTASSDGKGGPFQDNFIIVKKAYKEATPSLFNNQ